MKSSISASCLECKVRSARAEGKAEKEAPALAHKWNRGGRNVHLLNVLWDVPSGFVTSSPPSCTAHSAPSLSTLVSMPAGPGPAAGSVCDLGQASDPPALRCMIFDLQGPFHLSEDPPEPHEAAFAFTFQHGFNNDHPPLSYQCVHSWRLFKSSAHVLNISGLIPTQCLDWGKRC